MTERVLREFVPRELLNLLCVSIESSQIQSSKQDAQRGKMSVHKSGSVVLQIAR